MISGRNLCWLNASVQLILSNDELVNSLLKSSLSRSVSQHSNITDAASVMDDNDGNGLLDFCSKIDQCNYQYLLDVLQSPIDKSLPERRVRSYIDDLQKYGPKANIPKTHDHIPVIHPFGQISCVNEYLASVLLPSMKSYGDITLVYDQTILCPHCRAENVLVTERHNLLPLKIGQRTDLKLLDAALDDYFLDADNDEPKTCPLCGKKSSSNQYQHRIVQLPDTLFLYFVTNQYLANSGHQVAVTECFPQEKLDMSDYASKHLICYPSYFNYELNSFVVTHGDKETNRHYRTLTKRGAQFFRCDDNVIESIDKSLMFGREHCISIAMYTRCKNDHVDFADMISSIIGKTDHSDLTTSMNNAHVRLMFDAALEHVARGTTMLSWSHGFLFTCLHCDGGNIDGDAESLLIFEALFCFHRELRLPQRLLAFLLEESCLEENGNYSG